MEYLKIKHFGKSQTNFFITLVDNPQTAEGFGCDLKSCQEAGFRRMYDLWGKGKFMPTEVIIIKYNIPVKVFRSDIMSTQTGSLELSTGARKYPAGLSEIWKFSV
ncbi:hypothetical protein AMECASPLE_015565 [Ameca splendens]|uniref:Uncharacterized protein n=1 Tax=Ameca splendens TaxID=208324 RepID=A0ABV0Y1U3_9TELE